MRRPRGDVEPSFENLACFLEMSDLATDLQLVNTSSLAAPTTLTSKVATRSHTKRRPHNVGRTLRRRQLARHGASPAPTRSIPPTLRAPPRKNIVIIATDPAPRSPSFLFVQFMRVGAVAVGLGYGAVMGMFSGLVRSRSIASPPLPAYPFPAVKPRTGDKIGLPESLPRKATTHLSHLPPTPPAVQINNTAIRHRGSHDERGVGRLQ